VPKANQPRASHGLHALPTRRETLRIGFVPIIDCAVLIAAQELGLFAQRGLSVRLQKEVGWATIREKLLHEELEAVHAPASMGFAIRCGLGVVPRPCLTAFVLSLNGSAITLSRELWESGVRDAASLRALIERDRGRRTYRFGAVLELSTQNLQLRAWLRAGGIDPDRDVRIEIVPSPVIHRGLLEGHLNGYCVAEPWNSIVTQAGAGWVVATSAELDPGLPEKVLLVLERFEQERPHEHRALVAALAEASIFCERPEHRVDLIAMLAQPRYLDVPASLLGSALSGQFDTGRGVREIAHFITYHRHGANIPDLAKGRRVYAQVRALEKAQPSRALRRDAIPKIFREDIYREACATTGLLPHTTAPPELPRLHALSR
jgi:ABC-type nitrate/sulfonate/bicarbonate transport system substrate-binding protein